MLLNGKVGMVTGAGTGLGQAAALAMAREGATVVLGEAVGPVFVPGSPVCLELALFCPVF